MRLIDADRLKRQVEGRSWRAKSKIVELIDNSPTIRVGENTCKHRTPDGVCKLYTDEHFTSYCIDGPCPNEEPIPEDETSDVKHGRWEEKTVSNCRAGEWQSARCSACGRYHTTPYLYYFTDYKYCPSCGARMDLKEGKRNEVQSDS